MDKIAEQALTVILQCYSPKNSDCDPSVIRIVIRSFYIS